MPIHLFISDLHLSEGEPNLFRLFCHFLKTYAYKAQALYILGDLFEAWIGDDDLTPFHQSVIAELAALTGSGVPAYLLHGNRDFLLGKQFSKLTGVTLLPDPYLLRLPKEQILLIHGDSLCSNDKTYMRFRKFVRAKPLNHLFLKMPLPMRRTIASILRRFSQRKSQNKAAYALDVNQQEVVKQLNLNQATTLIHGHIHIPGRYKQKIDGRETERIVLGAWHKKGNVLVLHGQRKEWLEFGL